MTHSMSRLALLMIALLVCDADRSPALQPIEPTLEMLVEMADVIGRIRIIDSSPVTFEFEGTAQTCGQLLSARVVEALKGEARVISIFVPSRAGFYADRELDYLVLASGSVAKANSPAVPPTIYSEAEQLCEAQAGGSVLVADPIPFIHVSTATRSERGNDMLQATALNSRFGAVAEAGVTVEWNTAKKMILRAVGVELRKSGEPR